MTESLTLTLTFYEKEPAQLQLIADNTADPTHSAYGQHLDRAQLAALVALPEDERQLVADWLTGLGMVILDSHGLSSQLMFVRATTQQVEAAFGQDMLRWLSRDEGCRGERLASAIPRRLAGYVQKVSGLPGDECLVEKLIGAPVSLTGAAAGGAALGAATVQAPPGLAGATPADIREIYNFPAEWDGSGETIALMMLGGQIAESDLHCFWRQHGISPPEVRLVQVGPVAQLSSNPLHSIEVAMTVEWVGAMAPGARLVVYQIDPLSVSDPWAAFLLAVVGDTVHAPTIACTSWITPERKYYRLHGHSVVTGLLNQAAALGITVVSAAGDWGAFDGIPRTMHDGRYVSDAPWPHGVFPAVEERVLAVGGTMITHLQPLTEIAWSAPPPPGLRKALQFERLAGSGGFSEDVPIPAWQKPALRGYYSRGAGTPAVVPFGRGFPDVALMAAGPSVQRSPNEPLTSQGYQAVVGGQWIDYAGGTSVAAPIWATIIARANQARQAAGLSRLGFVNPLLYSLCDAAPAPFRPVTEGAADVDMMVVNVHGRAVTYHLPGYQCRLGWDPVTGLGVPHVSNLIQLVQHMKI